MKLMDVEFGDMETARVKCIENDMQKAVSKWKRLYPMDAVTGDAGAKGYYLELLGSKDYRDYVLWNDCGGLFAVAYGKVKGDHEVSNLKVLFEGLEKFKGSEGFKRKLCHKEETGDFISLADIMAMAELGEVELAEHYRGYRDKFIAKLDKEREEKEAQREAERRAEEEEREKAFQAKIAEAEGCIRTKKRLDNEELEDGKHIVMCLMKKYNINVPLRTQGWINSKLASVKFHDDEGPEVRFYRFKGCRCSESVFDYLVQLKNAVDAAG